MGICVGVVAKLVVYNSSTHRSVIKYIVGQSLYPYVCNNKHYPVCHPQCMIGPNLRGLDLNYFKGFIKCKVLSLRGISIPLLPCHITGKLMFVLSRVFGDTVNCWVCGNTCIECCPTGMLVSVEFHKIK